MFDTRSLGEFVLIKKSIAIFLAVALSLVALSATAAPKAKKYSPPAGQFSRCDYDPTLKGTASKIQEYLQSQRRCAGPMIVVNSKESTLKPTVALSSVTDLNPVEQCKVSQPRNLNEFRGFNNDNEQMYSKKRHPGAGTVIQIIGLEAPDAVAGKSTPAQDYAFYINYMKSWFGNVNNSGLPVQIRVTDKWYKIQENLKPLNLDHHNFGEGARHLGQEMIKAVDSDLDFSDVDYVLAVLPAGTRFDVASQTALGEARSTEKLLVNMSLAMPLTTDPSQSHYFSGFLVPVMFMHELYHPGFNMGDQDGDGLWKFENRGMGMWGMFASGSSDMLQWQKWLLGFTTDSQVACVPSSSKTTTLLTPGSTKSSKVKLVVVPLSQSEVLVVESVRATGANYKLTKPEQGALVYTMDLNVTGHGMGYEVQVPDKRGYEPYRYSMGTAPLKKGETVTYKGVKITNVEWGPFGDVIKVEPAK